MKANVAAALMAIQSAMWPANTNKAVAVAMAVQRLWLGAVASGQQCSVARG